MGEVSFLVHIDEGLDFFGSVECSFATFGLLVGLVNDEALHDGVHGNAVDGHEEESHCKGHDEDQLNKGRNTMSR